MADLDELFEALGTTMSLDGTKSAPLRLLPDIIEQYEARKHTVLMSEEEKVQVLIFGRALKQQPQSITQRAFALANPEQPVGPNDLLLLLGAIQGSLPPVPPTPSPIPSSPLNSPLSMLSPEPNTRPLDGSPAPRGTSSFLRPRTSSRASNPTRIPSPAPSSPSGSAPNSPEKKDKTKRLSFLARLSSSGSLSGDSKRMVQRDLSDLAVTVGAPYLGVKLEGPWGEDWDPEGEADKLRGATKGMGTRESIVIGVLADKTFPQIRSIDRQYKEKYDKTLLEVVESEGSLKNNSLGRTLKALILGPLSWDVELILKATDTAIKPNEHLITELLVSRPPAAISLLRSAYARRHSSNTGTPLKSARISLDEAVLSTCVGNAKLKKVYQVVLDSKWEDVAEGVNEERRKAMLGEDVDQLKVAFRAKPLNSDVVSKILLARSPEHLHAVINEYKKVSGSGKTGQTLSKAIKTALPTGQLRSIFLHAVKSAKHDLDGAWRDAKLIMKSMVGMGTKNDELSWRLVRAHWDRPRFRRIQAAFKKKYLETLVEKVHSETSGHLRHLFEGVISSAAMPEPTATPDDLVRLEALKPQSRSRGSSVSSVSSSRAGSEAGDRQESAVLEGSGELEQPPSPRSPPPPPMRDEEESELDEGQATPLVDNFRFDEPQSSDPTMPTSPSLSSLNSSTSSTSSVDSSLNSSASSLSFRRRSAPLEAGHRPASSAAGSGSQKGSNLRHSRPVAPARNRRQSGDQTGVMRPGSTEPTDLSRSGSRSPIATRSPTPSAGGSDRAMSPAGHMRRSSTSGIPRPHSRAGSNSSFSAEDHRRESSGSSTGSLRKLPSPIEISSPPSSPPSADMMGRSPPASIDTKSYHAPPISPVGDVGPVSSSPNSLAPYSYPLGSDYYAAADATPDRSGNYFSRRDPSSASNGSEQRPGSMFFGEAEGVGGYRPDSIAGFPNYNGRPGSTASGGSGDQFQAALRQIQDLSRKLKDSEERYQQSSSTFEQEHSELESRLEETRAELQTKRREEKELRNTEKEHLAGIASLEADVSKLTKQVERAREQFETMKRNYQDQCAESEKLRTLVAETRRENREAEQAAHQHGVQVQQFERDRELVQLNINKLEEDLSLARRAQDQLDEQKAENLLLKETIDRLKFDMDELRGSGRRSVFFDGTGGSSGGTSTAGSISKSLGSELQRHIGDLADEDAEEEDGTVDGSDEEVDDIVVTTHRRVKKRTFRPGEPATAPTITHVQETTVVVDADTQTDTVETSEMDVQTDLAAVATELVAAPAVETQVEAVLEPTPPKSAQEIQELLASDLGIELSALQDFIQGRKRLELPPAASTTPRSPSDVPLMSTRRANRWGSRISSRVGQAPSFLVGDALADFAKGDFLVVVDDESRENEGDLIIAADKISMMVENNEEKHKTAYTVTCDYKHGTTTGISAHDRALTALKLADQSSKPEDFSRPGHMVPLRAVEGGVLARRGHTEASVDLCKLSGLSPAGIICELVNPDDPMGGMARRDDCFAFARTWGIKMISIEQLEEYRKSL
ncbi:hypothetical protein P7C70_g5266, partial [Phenoliferia sp. Uapishka_3]